MSRFATRVLVCLAFASPVAAQVTVPADELHVRSEPYLPPPPPNTLRSQVNLVEVPVVVRDGKHRAVPGLTKDDFEVFDAGKKQAITAFSVETFTPKEEAGSQPAVPAAAADTGATPAPARRRFILLAFDTISTEFGDLRSTKTAAEKFVRTGLAPGDLVAVVTTAWPQNAEFTADPAKLVESIEKLSPQPRFSDNNTQCPRITAYQAYLISNNMDDQTLQGAADELMACQRMTRQQAIQTVVSMAHAIWEHARSVSENTLYAVGAMVDGLSKLPGRRMILLASAGFLSGNLEYLEDEMTAKAVHAEVVINSLDSKGLYTITPGRPIDAPPTRAGRNSRTQVAELSIQSRQAQARDDGMAVLALGTGGTFYHNSNDLDKGFHELGTIPELVYVLGFSPDDLAKDGRYHSLKVRLTGKHYALQARLGYSAPTNTPPPEPRKPSKLDNAVMSSDMSADVPATMALDFGKQENGTPTLTFVVHFDAGRLKFQKLADRHVQKLTILLALLDPKGNFFAGRQCQVELALRQDTYDKLAGPGFNVTLPVAAPAGSYTLRALVEDDAGNLTASSRPIELK